MVTLDSGSRKGADSPRSKQSVFARKGQQIPKSKKTGNIWSKTLLVSSKRLYSFIE